MELPGVPTGKLRRTCEVQRSFCTRHFDALRMRRALFVAASLRRRPGVDADAALWCFGVQQITEKCRCRQIIIVICFHPVMPLNF